MSSTDSVSSSDTPSQYDCDGEHKAIYGIATPTRVDLICLENSLLQSTRMILAPPVPAKLPAHVSDEVLPLAVQTMLAKTRPDIHKELPSVPKPGGSICGKARAWMLRMKGNINKVCDHTVARN